MSWEIVGLRLNGLKELSSPAVIEAMPTARAISAMYEIFLIICQPSGDRRVSFPALSLITL